MFENEQIAYDDKMHNTIEDYLKDIDFSTIIQIEKVLYN